MGEINKELLGKIDKILERILDNIDKLIYLLKDEKD